MLIRFIYFIATALLVLPFPPAQARSSGAGKQPCAPFSFDGHNYTLCEAPLSRFDIQIFWKRPDGAPYTYLSALPKTDKKEGKLAFALNAGMFHPDYRPVGLYVGGRPRNGSRQQGFRPWQLSPETQRHFLCGRRRGRRA